jgi:hypothetical protein
MIITKKLLDSGRSSRGGWNALQCKLICSAIFGNPNYKDQKGWLKSAIGRYIHDEVYEQFLSLRSEKAPRKGDFVEAGNITWAEQYKHPNWQKKRLEILRRDCFRCCHCGDNQSLLHVHHLRYTAPLIWLEPSKNLTSLCDNCHSTIHGKQL